ncbi:MAG: 50S ribosomal protein L22 [Candidatus Zambryskibacteria bacterium RIFCSPHIGHO2_01_FULL_43_25]|uniref:Large ribosomal subunit protein uL22 n=1 Tax=Candidatus Zambryskibacteria bacterium RIFCSPLOWO2_01_FULL_45_21 TaxID=1802761 RepID=A0A1G2U4K6_9BACT|nr:MAG: 50S ribosomal protein L22 [Candidatus Zambryskibacteria bacterium RIFCSPHIGHO2_01_FULL_43_25]OHB00824.1 MAG: 50S ribosomal protein L22 [Candidatus Zambryskibacteria bacterium RIFCSPHIGHO2_12_FULL_44_12b]OHB04419.1 MAG: 50S ribosomal protein L22 [Candidatus Zambryskibacteria bacterium RIFCSPLOWO2_01_FULL_45_21]
MAQITAQLNNLRHSPRKVRLVADLVRGKSVTSALNSLAFADKKATRPIIKLIKSAIANAKTQSLSEDKLTIKEIRVDGGSVLKRFRPAAFGRAHPIRKRSSHVRIILTTNNKQPATKAKIAKNSRKSVVSSK